jgi:cation diffusion facilitator CzcD-associated flavoprotein CzcO
MAPLAERQALRHLQAQVPDAELRARLTPSYRIGCKRVLVSDDYLPAVAQPNVELVTNGIAEVDARGIVTRDGRSRPVDAIIFGTGFHVTDVPFGRLVHGRDGRSLDTLWNGSPRAHLGLSVPGYPNFFFLLGPNTGLGHSSVILMIESQVEHVLAAVRHLRRRNLATMEPRPEAEAAFVADVDARMRSTVWSTGGCKSWYIDRNGRNSALWPSYTFSFRRRTRFAAGDYAFEPRAASGRAEEAA